MDIFGDFGLVGAFDTPTNAYQDQQLCINWFPEISPSRAAKEQVSLLGAPGLIELIGGSLLITESGSEIETESGSPLEIESGTSGLGSTWAQPYSGAYLPVRGMWVLPGWTQALVVIGKTCYLATINAYGNLSTPGSISLTSVGTLATNSGVVNIRDNDVGGYAVLVDGPNGYLYNIQTQAFNQISDPAWLGSNTVAYIDGWWIFNQPGTQVFYTNYPQYGTAFAGSYYALKDASSDKLIGLIENKEELWLLGERTTEIWYDAGGQYFPFQRLVGSMLQVGCIAPYSIARLQAGGTAGFIGGSGLIWLGRSERGENVVVRTVGFTAQTVSTPAVSNAIAELTTVSDAIGYVYQEGTHEFYVLNFPTADTTWVYDATMPPELAWTQRLSYDPYAQAFHRHRSNCYMDFAGMRIVGDYQNGSLYQMTRNAYSDAGWPILARRRSPYIWNKETRERVFMSSLQIDFSPGQGTSSGLGVNPQAHLRISRDYGTTYGPVVSAPMGAQGQYQNRCMWRKLGWTRGTVAQLDVIDPVSRDIVGATLRAYG